MLIDQQGRPRLIDFGLARGGDQPSELSGSGIEELRSSNVFDQEAPLTRSGALMGTPQYMSPEQFENREATALSDQFSLCVALYEALYDASPFAGEGVHARALAVLEGELRQPTQRREHPVELFAVIERGLQVAPEQRWPDMRALLDTLRALLAAYDPEFEDPAAQRLRRRMLGAIVGVAMTTLLGGAAYGLANHIQLDAKSVLALDASMFVMLGTTAAASSSRWMANRLSRRLVSFILMLTLMYCAQDLLGYLVERPLYHTSLANALSFSILLFFVAPLTVDTLRWAGLWALLFTALMLLDPPRFYLYFHLANIGAGSIVAVLMPKREIQKWISNAASSRGTTEGRTLFGTLGESSLGPQRLSER